MVKRNLEIASLIGFSAAAVALVALQVARPDRTLFHSFVSELALGRFGAVMTAVFVVTAASCLLLVVAQKGETGARYAWLFLSITAVGLLVMAVFPTDLNDGSPRTLTGSIHDTTSVITFIAVLLAMASIGWSRRLEGPLARLQRISRRLTVFCSATLAVQLCLLGLQYTHRPYRWVGLTERILIAAFLAWACAITATASGYRAAGRPNRSLP